MSTHRQLVASLGLFTLLFSPLHAGWHDQPMIGQLDIHLQGIRKADLLADGKK